MVMDLARIIWLQEKKGQTLLEYALIVVLISIVAIVVLTIIGVDVRNIFTAIGDFLTS
jgi:Flp pilus assembly pilin Flp